MLRIPVVLRSTSVSPGGQRPLAGLDDATTRFGRVKRAEPVLSPHNVIAIEPPTLGRSVALTQAVEQIFKMILRRTL